ncbi:MAG: phenylalanine--tRNA ligase subunit beta, partial [Candidatus Aenigmatarchaeota archaeon]
MPHIEIDKREFDELVGEKISEEKLDEKASFLGAHWNHVEGPKWDVESYPNRPDLLSVEGLARAYRGFFDVDTGLEKYTPLKEGDITVEVDSSVEEVRPYIGGAVVTGLELTEKKINGLIQLQEKLHETMGRQRDKLAIGLHDLEEVEPPFTYRAVEPEKVSFTPLEYDREMQLGEILEEHEKGQDYSWILEDEDTYPIIEDSEGKVLSFPPIINNQLTEVTNETRDIFIDVTGKDKDTVQKCLNILATALAERKGTVETVTVNGEKMPHLSPEEKELDVEYFREISGLELSKDEIVERLEKMKFGAKKKKDKIRVKVPCYRNDIMHQYDLIEDIVIAHGYDNIEPEMPEIDQVSSQKDIEEISQLAQESLVGAGALETHTYILSSKEKLYDRMEMDEMKTVEMSNALTEDYTCVRTWLLPTMLEVLKENRQHSYPQEFFEAGDVAIPVSENNAENRRKLAYVKSGNETDFTDAREKLQVLERDLGIELEVVESQESCFRKDRSAKIVSKGEEVGLIGEFSEEVCSNWELQRKVSGFEIDLEKIK